MPKDCNCNNKTTVDMHLGFTFRVGPLDHNQYARADINYNGLDTSLSEEQLKLQIERCREVSDKAFPDMKEFIDGQIDEILDGKN